MVCLGNICRSPIAEGLLAAKLPKDTFVVDSAGTGPWHVGKHPDERSIATSLKNGIDISAQRGQLFTPAHLDTFDYIYVMDNSNYSDVMAMAKNEAHKSKVSLILEALFPGEHVDVPDPYYGLQNGFDMVFEMLDEATDVIAKKLLETHG
ncbi:protein-tyrosine phosphatase [Flavobacterium aciduliphilum]|uniref:protein-tyrosine-phosphatase n=2 Tax=Flavobacterium aciduliphilum TaxID=1101402 RepID=A0A328YRK9_9FLAO|nr:protein-tyrosine phosphatase [Flavobacterium aciduliphilum]